MFKLNSSVALRSCRLAYMGMALLVASLTAGCGQKGPLTLPKPLPANGASSSPSAAAPGAASAPTLSPAASAPD
jgi:predicted small lipoprotein YifL